MRMDMDFDLQMDMHMHMPLPIPRRFSGLFSCKSRRKPSATSGKELRHTTETKRPELR